MKFGKTLINQQIPEYAAKYPLENPQPFAKLDLTVLLATSTTKL
jgi:hypothetical protein